MPNAPLFNMKGESLGEIELPESVFGIVPNSDVVHEAVVMQLASRRAGTHDTKTISEVSGGGRKPWRQKGTGRARQGSRRSTLWVVGATVFGPTPRKYGYKLPKKVRRLALKSALSSKALENGIFVFDNIDMEKPCTKEIASMLKSIDVKQALIVTDVRNEIVEKSANNMPKVKAMAVDGLNVYDILNHSALILTADAVQKAGEALA